MLFIAEHLDLAGSTMAIDRSAVIILSVLQAEQSVRCTTIAASIKLDQVGVVRGYLTLVIVVT